MKVIENKTFDEERALYGSNGVLIRKCRFDGPADGESALKESQNITVENCWWNLRYPFWHDKSLKITGTELTELCRASIWYSSDIEITDSRLYGIKALRECSSVVIKDCDIRSKEFGWSVKDIVIKNCTVKSEYFMMRSEKLCFSDVEFIGKYSFQYITDSVFENCVFDTKDAFWHSRNVKVKNSVIKGEYLAWYSESLTLENCKIIGTQPLCYCKGLKLIDCEMIGADLSFEKSEVEASLTAPIVSIKNPTSGKIFVPAAGEIIRDDINSKCEIITAEKCCCA